MEVFDLLVTKANISLAAGVFVLMQTLKMVFPTFSDSRLGQRLTPVLPLVLGVAGAMAGICTSVGWQHKLTVGLIAGFSASNVFKVGKTTCLGKGLPGVVQAVEDQVASVAPVVAAAPKKEG